MNCPKCNAAAPAEAAFCPKCGTNLATGAKAEVPRGGARGIADAPEETLWEGRFSPKAMFGTWIFLAVVAVAALVLAVVMLFSTWSAYWWLPIVAVLILAAAIAGRYFIRRVGTRYRLSNHRFFHEEGILNRKVNPIDLITITDVSWEQGFVERMLGVGRVKIMSSDTSDPVLWVEGIEGVQNVATLIDTTRREEMLRRRVFYDASPNN